MEDAIGSAETFPDKPCVSQMLVGPSLTQKGRMNFLVTVLSGISDPELVFGFHSSHVVMCILIHLISTDLTPADKVLKKTPLDLQKRFLICHACPKYLAAHRCGSAFPQNGLAFRQDRDKMGATRVDR